MADPLRVRVDRIGHVAFEAATESGRVTMDASAALGGEGKGMRPMELLLSGLAGCAAIDVVHILKKQKEPLDDLHIEVVGTRSGDVPAVFTKIHLRFEAKSDESAEAPVHLGKLERAVRLSVEKYCSVRNSLAPGIEITYEAILLS